MDKYNSPLEKLIAAVDEGMELDADEAELQRPFEELDKEDMSRAAAARAKIKVRI